MKKISVGVVGTGRWGKNVVKNFADLGVLTAVVDSDESKGLAVAKEYQVAFYKDINELLATDIDAVAIATNVFSHFELAKLALLAKKDVFVEKPLTTTSEQADELIAIAKHNNCILMVGHLLLFQPAIQFIKKFIQSGQLGQVFSITQIRRSLGTIRTEENVLYSLGVHDLAVLDFLIGEKVSAIQASSQKIISSDIADAMAIHLHYPSGLQAHVHLSWLWPMTDRQLMVLGEKGALHFNELAQEVTFYRHFGNKDATITKQGHEVVFAESQPPLRLELEHFLNCIENRQQPLSSGELGREVVELMARIMKAEENSYDRQLHEA